MRIPCPFCGPRDVSEFVSRGEAVAAPIDGDLQTLTEALYGRDNVCGPAREHWHHAYGCRRWMEVERDTRTHAISGARLLREPRP